ncbi:MAG: ISC system 2Fe-2S type ferredoxin [Candidatus Dasytiphilus stammeri]
MPTIIFLPHPILIPEIIKIDAVEGETILDAALRNGILIEHACEKSCACATCHCIVRKGFSSLISKSDNEEDMLDKAWGVSATSRLSCQAKIANQDLVIEIPRYNVNIVD